jgi:hypothetical protein
VLGDERARQRADERVLAHVEGVGGDRRGDEVVGELLLRVHDDALDGPAVEAALADLVHGPGGGLPDVDGAGDDLVALVLLQPLDGDGGVEAAGVGEDEAGCGHGVRFLVVRGWGSAGWMP